MKVVLDTNVLLVSVSSKSKYHWLFQGLLDQKYEIVITNEILTEYEEIIAGKYSVSMAKNVIRTLLILPNVVKIDVYYKWQLIEHDPDDDKFADCAVAGNANYIVTNDKHFNVLRDVNFPKIWVIDIAQFQKII